MMKIWRITGNTIENAGCVIGFDRIERNHDIQIISNEKIVATLNSSNNMIVGDEEIPLKSKDGCDCDSCERIRKAKQ